MESKNKPKSLEMIAVIYSACIIGVVLMMASLFSTNIREPIYGTLTRMGFNVMGFWVALLLFLLISVTFIYCYSQNLRFGYYIGIVTFAVLAVRSTQALANAASINDMIIILVSIIVSVGALYSLYTNRKYFSKSIFK